MPDCFAVRQAPPFTLRPSKAVQAPGFFAKALYLWEFIPKGMTGTEKHQDQHKTQFQLVKEALLSIPKQIWSFFYKTKSEKKNRKQSQTMQGISEGEKWPSVIVLMFQTQGKHIFTTSLLFSTL